MAKAKPISMTATVKATPSEVFTALTDSKTIHRWSGQKGTVQPKIGGKFEFFDGWVKGKVLAYEKGKTVSYTWHTADMKNEVEPSIVRFTLSSSKWGTKISLKHSGLPDEKSRKEHQGGWTEFVFDPLKEFFGPQEPGTTSLR
ncbi:MAG TPA: SRPBCC domain-containing protein [Bacteroidota bacterium]|nr:SRPBCC domain-containing protein [Bacteroidota bacterium]